jgi:hypothetical protein
MSTEPDWDSLSIINFLLNRRMSEHLNAALAAISLIGTEDADNQPPEMWQARALDAVLQSLNLHNAWASLIRYKQGETFLAQHMRQFSANEMLHWLASEMQLSHFDPLSVDITLCGNRETLQEALLLIHSCANTLGPGVRLQAETQADGMWFRVRYNMLKSAPPSLDKLMEVLDRLSSSWRAQNAFFELKRARDFLAMNDQQLHYNVGQDYCELAFFVPTMGKVPAKPQVAARSGPAQTQTAPAAPVQAAPSKRPMTGMDGSDTLVEIDVPARRTTHSAIPRVNTDFLNDDDTTHGTQSVSM